MLYIEKRHHKTVDSRSGPDILIVQIPKRLTVKITHIKLLQKLMENTSCAALQLHLGQKKCLEVSDIML